MFYNNLPEDIINIIYSYLKISKNDKRYTLLNDTFSKQLRTLQMDDIGSFNRTVKLNCRFYLTKWYFPDIKVLEYVFSKYGDTTCNFIRNYFLENTEKKYSEWINKTGTIIYT